MTITTTTKTTRSSRRTTALSLAVAVGVLIACGYAVQPVDALFWPRLGFPTGGIDDAWDHHFRAIDHLNAVTNALFHPQPFARARVSTTRAAAPAAAAAAPKQWQPLRSADSAWDRLIAAQAKQWACSAHCRARARATLPYEAEVSERTGAGAGADVEIALRLPNVKPNDVHVRVVGGDTLSIKASRAPRTHAPNALDTECGCANGSSDAHDAAEEAGASGADTTAPTAVESIERAYSLGRFVDADRISATISQTPDTTTGVAGDFVTTVTVTVPKAVRPDTKRIALSEVAPALDAPAAVAAIAAPETAARALEGPAPTGEAPKDAAPAAPTTDAATPAAAAEEPQFGTTAVAANTAAAPVRAASDATDDVINL